jgi:hypothetical protein
LQYDEAVSARIVEDNTSMKVSGSKEGVAEWFIVRNFITCTGHCTVYKLLAKQGRRD